MCRPIEVAINKRAMFLLIGANKPIMKMLQKIKFKILKNNKVKFYV
jgi:hypothetical protein